MIVVAVLEALWLGALVGVTLQLMRQCLDRERGLLAEVIAIGGPLLMAAFYVLATQAAWTSNSLGWRLAPMVELVFWSLPLMLAGRLLERLRRGGQLGIVDLFRLTTAVAVTIFVFTALNNPFGYVDVFALNAVYFAAEFASATRRWQRNLAYVFSCGLLAAIGVNLLVGRAPAACLSLEELAALPPAVQSAQSIELLRLSLWLGVVVTTPHWLPRWASQSSWLGRWGVWLARWRLGALKPSLAIAARPLLDLWSFEAGVCYLNHGSFGAVPVSIRACQQRSREACEREPLDFLARQLEKHWLDARLRVAAWLGTAAENIAFCENATSGMNDVASSFPLSAGDQVLINDHEYGAVKRIWQRACARAGAELVTVSLPLPFSDPRQIVSAILAGVSPRTKLVVVSHVTSPTAVVMPVAQLCEELKKLVIPICIDGPHALLQEHLKLHALDCDFYTASCHKWLCAPLGSGLLYVAPRWQAQVSPARLSWGRLQPAQPSCWSDEFLWAGTRDYSAYLSIPLAIDFFQGWDAEWLDARNHGLACYAREQLLQLPGTEPVTPADRRWFGWMVGVWLPPGDHSSLQQRLWEQYRIEVPIIHFSQRWLVRVSCHLYVTTEDITRLCQALKSEFARSGPQ